MTSVKVRLSCKKLKPVSRPAMNMDVEIRTWGYLAENMQPRFVRRGGRNVEGINEPAAKRLIDMDKYTTMGGLSCSSSPVKCGQGIET
jgi:hypothetical protein